MFVVLISGTETYSAAQTSWGLMRRFKTAEERDAYVTCFHDLSGKMGGFKGVFLIDFPHQIEQAIQRIVPVGWKDLDFESWDFQSEKWWGEKAVVYLWDNERSLK